MFTPSKAPKDKAGKPKPLKEWGLKDYLDVANELGWIRQSAKDVGQVLRDYRNYLHPEKELSHGVSSLNTQRSAAKISACSRCQRSSYAVHGPRHSPSSAALLVGCALDTMTHTTV